MTYSVLKVPLNPNQPTVGRQEGHPACKKYGGMVQVGTG